MDMIELLNLRARLWSALRHKHVMAGAEGYGEALEKEAGPVDYTGRKYSTEHLLALVDKAIKVKRASEKPAAKEPAPTATVEPATSAVAPAAPKAAPKPAAAKTPSKG